MVVVVVGVLNLEGLEAEAWEAGKEERAREAGACRVPMSVPSAEGLFEPGINTGRVRVGLSEPGLV